MDKRHRTHPAIRARAREMRQPQTPAETKIWARLRHRQLGDFKFRRRHPIGRLVAHFYCAACRLVIEIDGDSHTEQGEYGLARSAWLSEQGYRLSASPIVMSSDTWMRCLKQSCANARSSLLLHPLPRGERAGVRGVTRNPCYRHLTLFGLSSGLEGEETTRL